MFNLNAYEYFEDINFGITKYMPKKKKVLDVGCGNGLMGQLYKKGGQNICFGIDHAPAAFKVASKRLDKFYLADIDDPKNISKLLGKNRFDVIILADVLEHLYDPVAILSFYKKFLKKDGQIYVSVPNVAVWYVRMWILLGRFNYTQTGLLEKTHIRFFTEKNLLMLIENAGLKLEKLDYTPGIARYFLYFIRDHYKGNKKNMNRKGIIGSPLFKIYAKYIYPLEYLFCLIYPKLFAYQFIAILKVK